MNPWLVCASGATIVVPSGDSWVLGRAIPGEQGVDLDLTPFGAAGLGVSRQHARLSWLPEGFVIEDLRSHNGTSLNRYRLSPGQAFPVTNGDRIRLGSFQLIFVREAAP